MVFNIYKKTIRIAIGILLLIVVSFIAITLILEYNQMEFKIGLDDVDISICKDLNNKYLTMYGKDNLPVLYNVKSNDNNSLNLYAYRMRYQVRNKDRLQEYGTVVLLIKEIDKIYYDDTLIWEDNDNLKLCEFDN